MIRVQQSEIFGPMKLGKCAGCICKYPRQDSTQTPICGIRWSAAFAHFGALSYCHPASEPALPVNMNYYCKLLVYERDA